MLATRQIRQPTRQALSVKQELFCKAYIETQCASEAVRLAGYNTKYPNKVAYQLMINPAIKQRIEATRRHTEIVCEVSLAWKLDKLRYLVETNVDTDKEIALKALAELNKMQGHYAPEKSLSIHAVTTLDNLAKAKLEYKDE